MDRIYEYNPYASYKPNGGRYLQLISGKDLYIQNITVAEYDGHSDSFQVKFPNVFTEDQTFKDWDHYKLNFMANETEFCCLLC